MRPIAFLVPFALSLAWIACSDDGASGGGPTTNPDGGTSTTPGTPPSSNGDAASNSDSGNGGSDKLTTGDGYVIAYTDNSTIDARWNVTATFDDAGGLTKYDVATVMQEKPEIGSATVDGLKTDGIVAVGRWLGGPTAGQFYGDYHVTYAADDGFHWAIGKRASEDKIPTGAATYVLDLADNATLKDAAAPGKVTALTVTLGAGDGGLTATMSITYDVGGSQTKTGTGRIAPPFGTNPPQLRGEIGSDIQLAGLFVGDDRMAVVTTNPVHSALSLKKQ